MKRKDRQHGDSPAHAGDDALPYRKPSKSQLKRDMTALQELGEELLRLQPSKLKALPLPPALFDAIELAQRITAREGLRRQRQYIGRLMREVDAQPIRDALSVDGARHRVEVAHMHTAEHWRDRLLAEPKALAEFLAEYPGAASDGGDAAGAGGNAAGESGWKARIESARLEKTRNQPGRAYRELYRQLYRVLDAGAADAGIPGTAAAANTAGAAGAARTSSPARGAIRTGDVIQDDETGRNDDDQ